MLVVNQAVVDFVFTTLGNTFLWLCNEPSKAIKSSTELCFHSLTKELLLLHKPSSAVGETAG